MKCVHCDEDIVQERFMGNTTWSHPDLYDIDCHGVYCSDGENVAEPTPAPETT